MRSPRASATRSPGKAQRQRHAQHQQAIHSTPEPAKPSQRIDRPAPAHVAQHAAGMAGHGGSQRYRRVHSSAQLAASSSTSPARTPARHGWRVGQRPRSCAPASASQARAGPPAPATRPKAEQEQCQSDSPGAQQPRPVAQRRAGARGGEAGVGGVVAWPAPAAAAATTPPAPAAELRAPAGQIRRIGRRGGSRRCRRACRDPRRKVMAALWPQAGCRTGVAGVYSVVLQRVP
jgi:hypothetical protein